MIVAEELQKATQDFDYQFESRLFNIYLRWKRELISVHEMGLLRSVNEEWYHSIYFLLNPPTVIKIDSPEMTKELRQKYDTEPDFPLAYIICYHGEMIPVYDDDYGQQYFAKFRDMTWSGGAYNLYPDPEFCERLDSCRERAMWQAYETESASSTED